MEWTFGGQGLRSNFEIGVACLQTLILLRRGPEHFPRRRRINVCGQAKIGGAQLVTRYWGGTRHFFLLTLYNFKNIGGGGGGHMPPSCSAVPGGGYVVLKLI